MNRISSRIVMKNVSATVAVTVAVGVLALFGASAAHSQSAAFQVSGDGAIGKDSVQVGKDFSLDLYLSNAGPVSGFTLGFKLTGKNGLKSLKHLWPKDSKDPASNVTAYNGFDSTKYWDFGKLQKPVFSWDGKLPDSILIGGVSMNKGWPKTDKPVHYVSIAMRATQPGSICIDSAYIPPSGAWLFSPEPSPKWAGEYCVTAVGGKAANPCNPCNPCAGKSKKKSKK